jgi:hypothetical protein
MRLQAKPLCIFFVSGGKLLTLDTRISHLSVEACGTNTMHNAIDFLRLC